MPVSRKRVQRLMRAMGLRAIYRRPGTSRSTRCTPTRCETSESPGPTKCGRRTPLPAHGPGVPLPGGSDGLAQPVRAGLAVVRYSGGRLLRRGAGGGPRSGQPEVFNTAQGSQFTSWEFTQVLQARGVRISMDGKGRYQDNIFVERLWRTVKYEEVYLKAYASVLEAQRGLEDYFRFYNGLRPHQALGYRTQPEVFYGEQDVVEVDSTGRRGSPEQGTQ